MIKTLVEIAFTIVALLAFALWGLFSIYVVFLILAGWGGISKQDLHLYMYTSIAALPIYCTWLAFRLTRKKS